MKRKPGTLLDLELHILAAAMAARDRGEPTFHGFHIAKALRDTSGARSLTAQGTLYKALARLERAGFLTSTWEDPAIAADEHRPRRRLYEVTGMGALALADALRQQPAPRSWIADVE